MSVFGYPCVLALIVLVPLMALFYRWAKGRDARARESLANPARHGALNLGLSGRRARVLPIFIMTAIALAAVSLARPLGAPGEEGEKAAGMDVIVALDISDSMGVPDAAENRLAAAKGFIAKLVQAAPDSRYGLVLFSGDAIVSCPLTMDHDAFLTFLGDADFVRADLPGTALGEAVLSAATRFRHDGLPRAIVVVSDGENTYGADPAQAAATAKEKGLKVYAVGVGTATGGRIPAGVDFFGNVRYKQDREGRAVNSSLDEPALREMAAKGGGKYFNISDAGSVKGLAGELAVKGGKKVKDPFKGREEYGPWFALAAAALAAVALAL